MNHLKIGLFLLTALFLMVGGLLIFGGRRHFEPTTLYETYVTGDVEGLSVGSVVKFRGVQVGTVRTISFSWHEYPGSDPEPNLVIVRFEIVDAAAPAPGGRAEGHRFSGLIEDGMRARVKGQGITGTSFLSLEMVDPRQHPPANVPWTPRHPLIPSAPGMFTQMIASMEQALRRVEKLDFEGLTLSIQKDLDGIGRILEQLEAARLDQIGGNIDGLVAELRDTNRQMMTLLRTGEATLSKLEQGTLLSGVEQLVEDFRTTLAKVQPVIETLDLSPAMEAMTQVRQSAEQLGQALSELRQYPSSFLWGTPPPPARSLSPRRERTGP